MCLLGRDLESRRAVFDHRLMPRFVILRHETPRHSTRVSHWDLMFEMNDVLRTWALLDEIRPAQAIPAESLDDHRLTYLEFEGPLSNNRGVVRQWESGQYALIEDGVDRFAAQIAGSRLKGLLQLVRSSDSAQGWYAIFSTEPRPN